MAVSRLTPPKAQSKWISIRRPETILSWLESTKRALIAFASAWRGKAPRGLKNSPPKMTNGCYSSNTNERKNETKYHHRPDHFGVLLAHGSREKTDRLYRRQTQPWTGRARTPRRVSAIEILPRQVAVR